MTSDISFIEINLIEKGEQKAAVILVGEGAEREIYYMDQNGDFWDDVSGARLNKKKIQEARLEEIKQLYKHKVYKKSSHKPVLGRSRESAYQS